MSVKTNFELMADYNQWMNSNIYSAAAQLSATELAKERGAYFGSILGTLNHLLVGDTIWLKRFSEHPSEFQSLNTLRQTSYPESVNTILFTELDDLQKSRKKMDKIITAFSSELTDQILDSTLNYVNTSGKPFSKKLGALVQHFFNHQTHHRGQISTLLSQQGIDIGVTDLLVRIPE